ncbi:FAD-dependent monooxygenase [Microbacterium sp. 18062]|uniref:FAD-dependent monooxygenase n=1 Tax=Microbacterium sp. 18062 TaxID=2681410 RepID=UPI00135C42EC|nr:FAD-dependent monooxygenase [Microbacterium sp. 18062]
MTPQNSTQGRLSRGVVVVGAGPVGLIAALGLVRYGVPVTVLEADEALSTETKAGTVLTRTLEVLDRYDALDGVLAHALRLDEIGEIERATNRVTQSVRTDLLTEDTRFPFVINIPQNDLEAQLAAALDAKATGTVRFGVRVTGIEQDDDGVRLTAAGPDGTEVVEADIVLGADGGRSTIRELLGAVVEGFTLEDRYMLVDLKVDLDLANPREYPYLAYFTDPDEWMILVRQPHCWRFLYRLPQGAPAPSRDELREKALRFIGDVTDLEVIGTNVYTVHHRVADHWQDGRVFLLGDAAHLITPMWALGLNTGALDASNLPWRLAWFDRGWADAALLEGYEREQSPVAIEGSGQIAEEARKAMGRAPAENADQAGPPVVWGEAFTRTLLGVRLDVTGEGDWSMVYTDPGPVAIRVGDRAADLPLYGPDGRTVWLHQLAADSFLAVHFADTRRRPVPEQSRVPGLRHIVVSRWDSPLDTPARAWSYFDPGDRVRARFGAEEGTAVLLRPDGHVVAITSGADRVAELTTAYEQIVRPTTDARGAGR